MENRTPPPVDMSGDNLATHFSYLRRDVDEIKQASKEIGLKLDSMANSYVANSEYVHFKDFAEKTFATKEETSGITDKVKINTDNVEVLKTFMNTLNGKMLAMGGIAGIVGAGIMLIINHIWK